MHLRNGAFGLVDLFVHDICYAAVHIEGFVHGHPEVLDDSVLAKDLANVVFFDISGQSFDNDLHSVSDVLGQASDDASSASQSLWVVSCLCAPRCGRAVSRRRASCVASAARSRPTTRCVASTTIPRRRGTRASRSCRRIRPRTDGPRAAGGASG